MAEQRFQGRELKEHRRKIKKKKKDKAEMGTASGR